MKLKRNIVIVAFILFVIFINFIYPEISVLISYKYPIYGKIEFIICIPIFVAILIYDLYKEIFAVLRKLNDFINIISLVMSIIFLAVLIYSLLSQENKLVVLFSVMLLKNIICDKHNNIDRNKQECINRKVNDNIE